MAEMPDRDSTHAALGARSLIDAEATFRLGSALGRTARRGDALLLSGELGAGKTALAQGLARGLGVTEPVTSPTFAIVNQYRSARLGLDHFDCYRLDPGQFLAAGFDETFDAPPGVLVAEWPERVDPALWPPEALHLKLTAEGRGRRVDAVALGPAGAAWWERAEAELA